MSRANHKGLELLAGVLYFEGKALCNVEQILVGSQLARLEELILEIGGTDTPVEDIVAEEQSGYDDGFAEGEKEGYALGYEEGYSKAMMEAAEDAAGASL